MTDHNPLTSLKHTNIFCGRFTCWFFFFTTVQFPISIQVGQCTYQCRFFVPSSADYPCHSFHWFHPPGGPVPPLCSTDGEPSLNRVITALSQGKQPFDCAAGLWHCFLNDGVLCRHYTSSNNRTSHVQVAVPTPL